VAFAPPKKKINKKLARGKIFILSENYLPKIPNWGLEIPNAGNLRAKFKFSTAIISPVGNLYLSVGKL